MYRFVCEYHHLSQFFVAAPPQRMVGAQCLYFHHLDPHPIDPIRISRHEFDATIINYDTVLCVLPKFVNAPLGVLWITDKEQMTLILLIEDDEVYATLVHQALTQNGYQVIVAPTAMEGIILAEQMVPQIIITDIALPSVDGIMAIQLLREKNSLQDTPIIVATAIGAVDLQRRAWDAGCDAFLIKPFKIERLIELIQQYEHST